MTTASRTTDETRALVQATLDRHADTLRVATDDLERAQWSAEYAARVLTECQQQWERADQAAQLARCEAPILIGLAECREREAALLDQWTALHSDQTADGQTVSPAVAEPLPMALPAPETDAFAPPAEGWPVPSGWESVDDGAAPVVAQETTETVQTPVDISTAIMAVEATPEAPAANGRSKRRRKPSAARNGAA